MSRGRLQGENSIRGIARCLRYLQHDSHISRAQDRRIVIFAIIGPQRRAGLARTSGRAPGPARTQATEATACVAQRESKRDYGRNDQTTAERFSSTSNGAQFSVFSFQCSERAGAAGSLLPARVRHWRTSRQWGPQVLSNWSVLTGWVGMSPNWQKSLAHLCTRLHMPGHFLHMPEHPQTCLYMPEHARTAGESPSPKCKRWVRTASLACASG